MYATMLAGMPMTYHTGVIKRSTASIVDQFGNAADVMASVVIAMLHELLLKPASVSETHLRAPAVITITTTTTTTVVG